MKKIIFSVIALAAVSAVSAQTPLRFIKLDPKSTPTSEVRMVTAITDRPLRRFPDRIRLNGAQEKDAVRQQGVHARPEAGQQAVSGKECRKKTCVRSRQGQCRREM